MSSGSYERPVSQDWNARLGVEPEWYAVHTRSQHEKSVVSYLHGEGITTFLPLVTEIHRWSDRRKLVELPLFSCYAFVHMPFVPELWAKVLRVSGVLSFVGVRGQGVPIPRKSRWRASERFWRLTLRARCAHFSKLVSTCGFGEEPSKALRESWSSATGIAQW